jgi:hypothetical protein
VTSRSNGIARVAGKNSTRSNSTIAGNNSWLAAPVALAQPQRDACSRACAAAQYGPARCGANLGQRNETDESFEATSSGRFSLSITCV